MQHFLRKYAADFGSIIPSLAPEALALLQSAPWPGNIRQLENVARRILLDSRGLAVTREAAERALAVTGAERHPSSLSSLAGALLARAQRGEITDACDRLLAEAEKELITQAILLAEGNQAKAARWLGLSRLTLREKLTRLGLRAPSQE
jgi:DNA-binding NtrC family response regulator